MKKQIELSVLWVLLVLGFLAHTLADVMPAFWGESIVAVPTSANSRELIVLMMGISYTLPVLAIFLVLWGKHKAWRVIHAILMAIVGIILAVKSIKYVRENQCVDGEEDDNEEEEDENVGNEEEESEEEVSGEKGEEVSEKEEKETE